MATPTQVTELRRLVDEPDEDEYTTSDLSLRIDGAGGNLNRLARDIWTEKAAKFSRLVNVSESGSTRALSDLHKNALTMVQRFDVLAPAAGVGRSRTRRIERP